MCLRINFSLSYLILLVWVMIVWILVPRSCVVESTHSHVWSVQVLFSSDEASAVFFVSLHILHFNHSLKSLILDFLRLYNFRNLQRSLTVLQRLKDGSVLSFVDRLERRVALFREFSPRVTWCITWNVLVVNLSSRKKHHASIEVRDERVLYLFRILKALS